MFLAADVVMQESVINAHYLLEISAVSFSKYFTIVGSAPTLLIWR